MIFNYLDELVKIFRLQNWKIKIYIKEDMNIEGETHLIYNDNKAIIEIKENSEEEMKKAENQNKYKYRLLFEYRDIIEKRVKLEKYIKENEEKTGTEKQVKNMQLLKQQVEVLYRYEEIIYARLRLELSI